MPAMQIILNLFMEWDTNSRMNEAVCKIKPITVIAAIANIALNVIFRTIDIVAIVFTLGIASFPQRENNERDEDKHKENRNEKATHSVKSPFAKDFPGITIK